MVSLKSGMTHDLFGAAGQASPPRGDWRIALVGRDAVTRAHIRTCDLELLTQAPLACGDLLCPGWPGTGRPHVPHNIRLGCWLGHPTRPTGALPGWRDAVPTCHTNKFV